MERTALGGALALLMGAPIVAALPAVAGAQEARDDLSGQWILNQDESDDPRAMMRARREGGMPGRGGAGPGAGGEGRGGMQGRGRMGGRSDMEGMREAMAGVLEPATQLRLTVDGARVWIESIEGESLVLPTNGAAVETTVSGREVELAAVWKDGNLRVERRIEGGVRIVETYSREPESPRMIVTVLVEAPRTAVTLERVYDLARG